MIARIGFRLAGAVVLLSLLLLPSAGDVNAQRRQRAIPLPVPKQIVPLPAPAPENATPEEKAAAALPPETVQADISTREIAVTSSFAGSEIVVFGAVHNSRQSSAEAGIYDVVIVVVGTPTKLVARKKSRVAGMWLNTDSLPFDSVPSYYAIASTHPLDEVASPEVLKATGIGFEYVPMTIAKGNEARTAAEVKDFRDAIVRLKSRDGLYAMKDVGVAFIGPSLFRASIEVPANVVVGPFETRVYLFRSGELLHQYNARLDLERQGLEEKMHVLAFKNPLVYGLVMIGLATGAGLLAAAVFRGTGR
jgi:uncharacterized protein (TIGR02186 family)